MEKDEINQVRYQKMAENDLLVEACARAAHEVNAAYCVALGDLSQPSWYQAPMWQVRSAMDGARNVLRNPATTPEQSHENWFAQKRADGWVYGLEKDPEKKTHPCMVPYDELPKAQRAKDLLFITTVLAVARALGY